MQSEFVEFLEIQGAIDLIPKTEAIQQVRDSGRSISDRTLTYYIEQGVIPRSARVGSRQGVFPRLVVRLMTWVVDARSRGLSLDAVKELVPVWKELMRSRYADGVLDLAQLELIARNQVASHEANEAIPWLVLSVLHPGCDVCGSIKVLDKAGELIAPPGDGSLGEHISFVVTSYDVVAGVAVPISYTQLRLPGLGLDLVDDPRTVILGSPANVRVCHELATSPACIRDHDQSGHERPEVVSSSH